MTLILGIESSCDETAASIVEDGCTVLSNVVASQDELHLEYGGVVPEIASRAHIERILPVVREAIKQAHIPLKAIDGIAVGSHPGLIGSLLVGVAAAKTLSWALGKPLLAVDHVIAHLWAPHLSHAPVEYPALGVVVSGGHTSLLLLEDPMTVTCLGKTIDDAAGEAFDKAAAILHLGAKPVFVDVGEDQNIDVKKIEYSITNKTKGIMPVHLTGRMCDMDAILKISPITSIF